MNPTQSSVSEHWMAQAFELAANAALRDEVPVGALLVKGGEILGTGSNSREKSNRTTAHAEIIALEDYNRRFSSWRLPSGTFLFVTAEPCLMCTGALLWARLDRVVYGCPDPKNAGLTKVLPHIQSGTYDHLFVEVSGGILADRCSSLMSNYFKQKRQDRAAHPGSDLQLPS